MPERFVVVEFPDMEHAKSFYFFQGVPDDASDAAAIVALKSHPCRRRIDMALDECVVPRDWKSLFSINSRDHFDTRLVV